MFTFRFAGLIALLLLPATLLQAQVLMTYEFNEPQVILADDGYTDLRFDNCYLLGEEGEPLMPYLGANILLPPGQEVSEIRIKNLEYGGSLENVMVRPAPKQFPISKGAPEGYQPQPRQDIYNATANFPESFCSAPGTHFLSGHGIATFSICPVAFSPADSRITYLKSIRLEIITREADDELSREAMLKNHPTQLRRISNIVDNPEALKGYAYPEARTGEFDILFITDVSLEPYFDEFIDYKTSAGFIVETITTDNIYASYSGADEQEKIRNCIIDYYTNYNIFAVILGGDADKGNPSQNFIPHRGFYGSVDGDYDIPADMYYACLDGSWNDDGDLRWGEPGEDDLFAEVIIGRFAVEDSVEIAHMTHKQIMYQDQPVVDDIEKALMIGESLDSYTWGGDSKDEVADGSSNHGHVTAGVSANFAVEYLYERDQWWNKTHVFGQFNTTGVNLLNHLGHSNTTYNMKMYNSDVTTSNFTNDGVTRGYPIGYSQGCYNGAFDNRGTTPNSYGSDCFAEKITTIETAEVACVANSRYGLYSPGNTNGASQYFDREFYDAIFGEELSMIGEANGDSKSDLSSFIAQSTGLRWCCYILNVFGDPTLDIWTAQPSPIAASYPTAIPLGTSSISIETDAPGARIGLLQNGELIGRGLADEDGDLLLTLFNQVAFEDTIHVSVIAHNRERHAGEIIVITDQPFVCYDSHYVNDTLVGNGNGLSEYGESVKLSLKVTNMGEGEAEDVTVHITSEDPYVSITDSTEYAGNLAQNQLVMLTDGFEIHLSDDVPDMHEVLFTLRAEGQETWESNFTQAACAPAFSSGLLSIDDNAGGNGNGYLDPGETADLHIQVVNSGHSRAIDIENLISSSDPMVNILSGTTSIDTLETDEVFEAVYTVSTDPLAQRGATFELIHDMESGPYAGQGIYQVLNGIICEDWETGDFSRFNWTSTGQAAWEVTDIDPYERVYSARSGAIGDGQNSGLQAALFVDQDDSISFYLKTSSEVSDFLNFYINSELKGQWSGEGEWMKVSFLVNEGVNFFKWEYSKNSAGVSGEDCAWLDYIVMPFVNTASASAGPDQLICASNICELNGEVLNYNTFEWTTEGDGNFDDPAILDPVYTPGPNDIASGSVELRLAATFNQTGTSFDHMMLSIDEDPPTPSMPEGPEYVDLLTVSTSDYSCANISGVDEYAWKLVPLEAGTIEGNSLTGTVTWSGTYHGMAYVSVSAIDSCGHGPWSEAFEVLVDEGGLGLAEADDALSMTVYPNPSSGEFSLAINGLKGQETRYSLYHASGKLILTESVRNNEGRYSKEIDLGAYADGLYFLRLVCGEHSILKKIVKH